MAGTVQHIEAAVADGNGIALVEETTRLDRFWCGHPEHARLPLKVGKPVGAERVTLEPQLEFGDRLRRDANVVEMAVRGNESPDGRTAFIEHCQDSLPLGTGVEQHCNVAIDRQSRVHLQWTHRALEDAQHHQQFSSLRQPTSRPAAPACGR